MGVYLKSQTNKKQNTSSRSLTDLKNTRKEQEELKKFASECHDLRSTLKKQAKKMEKERVALVPPSETSLLELPLEERQAIRRARLKEAQKRCKKEEKERERLAVRQRQLDAYNIYRLRGKPSKAEIIAWINKCPRGTHITVADVELLPWKKGELKVSKTHMKKVQATLGRS